MLAEPDGAGGLTLQEIVRGLAGTLPASVCSEIRGKRCFKKQPEVQGFFLCKPLAAGSEEEMTNAVFVVCRVALLCAEPAGRDREGFSQTLSANRTC